MATTDGFAVLAGQVVQDQDGWWVLLTVTLPGEVVQRRIGPYLTEGNARAAAGHLRRAAGQDVPASTGS